MTICCPYAVRMVMRLKNEREPKMAHGVFPGGEIGNTYLGLKWSQFELGVFLLRIHPKENSKH